MSTNRWNRLSEWHNAWLKGDSADRQRLREELTSQSPDLVADADALVTASASMAGFLETPAFVLTAARQPGDVAGLFHAGSVACLLIPWSGFRRSEVQPAGRRIPLHFLPADSA